jgi:Tfp pilus assembly protein PilV
MPALLLSRLFWEAIVVAALLAAVGYQTMQKNIIKTEYAEYRTQVAQAAQAAAEQALKKTVEDERKKEAADAENLRLHAALDVTAKRLRDARRDSQFVPAAASCPDRPSSAAFDRTILERALRDLDTEVQGLVDEGSRAVIDLDTAKRWATSH